MRTLTGIGWVVLLSGYVAQYSGYAEIAIGVFWSRFTVDLIEQMRGR
jgi:hypothetical protein